ncbi:hypothetical protein ACTWP4_08120 [Gracilibacillus sp. D59]|uniref:hypothetical protein n=1 Tax=Gracilibacillus sp. D59 TaxID=3457434 RepID=UPI003FCE97E8
MSSYPADYKKVISNISKPTMLLVGSDDEEFIADAYQPLFQANSQMDVSVIKDANHEWYFK